MQLIREVARTIPFDNSTNNFTSDNVQGAIEELFSLKSYSFDLHFVSGTGLNTSMSNGNFFRVRPSTASSGSYSGYPAAFPLQVPFKSKLQSIVLTFREAAFDFNATPGQILFEIETREHFYNGSDVYNRVLARFGNFSGNSTGTDTFKFELLFNNTGGDGFEYIAGDEELDYATLIGCRFVKAPSGDRRINSFRDIVMKLNYQEVLT